MTFRRKTDQPRRDVAREITDLIVSKLEAGVLPWSRPWGLTGAGGRPLRHCGTPYTGINALYLWAIGDAQGFSGRNWMTYRQATELGGQVRRGEHGAHSVYYSTFSKTEADRVTGEAITEAEIKEAALAWVPDAMRFDVSAAGDIEEVEVEDDDLDGDLGDEGDLDGGGDPDADDADLDGDLDDGAGIEGGEDDAANDEDAALVAAE